jgi:hypothetical protein
VYSEDQIASPTSSSPRTWGVFSERPCRMEQMMAMEQEQLSVLNVAPTGMAVQLDPIKTHGESAWS